MLLYGCGKQGKHMKSAQLHENIRYISLDDEEGTFGLLIHHTGDKVWNVREVHSEDQFKRLYSTLHELVEGIY